MVQRQSYCLLLMVFGLPFRAVGAWFGRLLGINRQRWVEPGNPITRAVLSGADLTLPHLPMAEPVGWNEEADMLPTEAIEGPYTVDAPAPEAKPTDERTRAA